MGQGIAPSKTDIHQKNCRLKIKIFFRFDNLELYTKKGLSCDTSTFNLFNKPFCFQNPRKRIEKCLLHFILFRYHYKEASWFNVCIRHIYVMCGYFCDTGHSHNTSPFTLSNIMKHTHTPLLP